MSELLNWTHYKMKLRTKFLSHGEQLEKSKAVQGEQQQKITLYLVCEWEEEKKLLSDIKLTFTGCLFYLGRTKLLHCNLQRP